MRRSQVVVVVAALSALVIGLAAVITAPADAQIPITSTSSTTSRPTRSSTTTSRPSSTSSTKAPSATSSTRRSATTASTATTAPPRTTSTIATPAPAPTTTTLPVPVSNHDGSFSPVLSWLAGLGFLAGFALLALQWFLTRPGRNGWTL